MAKQSGLGDRLYVAGYNLSGDVSAIDTMHGGPALLDVTGIDKSGHERIGGQRDGEIGFNTFLNDAAGQQHLALRGLPTADVHIMYNRGAAIGNAGICLIGKQVDYKPTRSADGAMMFGVQAMANGYGIEADGRMLTAGLRTESTATNGTGDDELAGTPTSTAFGWSAYLQVTALTSGTATITVQDSADNSAYLALTGGAFTAVTSAPNTQRMQSSSTTATVRRYVRVATSGTFSGLTFAVVFIRPQELRAF